MNFHFLESSAELTTHRNAAKSVSFSVCHLNLDFWEGHLVHNHPRRPPNKYHFVNK